MDLPTVTEALLIASEEPLPTSELARLVRAHLAELEDESGEVGSSYEAEGAEPPLPALSNTSEEDIVAAIGSLNEQYEVTGRSFVILERSKGWKVYTRPEFAGFVRHLFPGHKPRKLSAPAMETLAIIAYRQPVTKAAIEAVRGVSCDGMLQKLLDLELIKIGGRADLPGRPLLYNTTDYFFEHFGIKDVDELPNASELRFVPLPEPEPEPENEAEGAEEGEEHAGSGEHGAPPAGPSDGEEKQLPLADPVDPPPSNSSDEGDDPDFAVSSPDVQSPADAAAEGKAIDS